MVDWEAVDSAEATGEDSVEEGWEEVLEGGRVEADSEGVDSEAADSEGGREEGAGSVEEAKGPLREGMEADSAREDSGEVDSGEVETAREARVDWAAAWVEREAAVEAEAQAILEAAPEREGEDSEAADAPSATEPVRLQ